MVACVPRPHVLEGMGSFDSRCSTYSFTSNIRLPFSNGKTILLTGRQICWTAFQNLEADSELRTTTARENDWWSWGWGCGTVKNFGKRSKACVTTKRNLYCASPGDSLSMPMSFKRRSARWTVSHPNISIKTVPPIQTEIILLWRSSNRTLHSSYCCLCRVAISVHPSMLGIFPESASCC